MAHRASGPSPDDRIEIAVMSVEQHTDVRRLELVLEASGLAWWELDLPSGAVRFHPRKAEMLGYEPHAFAHYTHFVALLHTADAPLAMAAMQAHVDGEAPEYRVDYRIRGRDGTYHWFQDVGRVTERGPDGTPRVVSGIVQDIGARKQLEQALREGQDRFRTLFKQHSAVKLVIDPVTGEIVDANDAAATFYGWSIDELTRMRIQQINQLASAEVESAITHAVTSLRVRFEFRHLTADGSIRDVEVFSNRVEVAGRALLYSIIHDIGDRKRVEATLRQHEQNLMHAEEFASFGHWEVSLHDGIVRASHGAARIYGFRELQQPLAAVQQCVVADDRPRLDAALAALLEHDVPYDQEFWIRRLSDGATVAVHSRAEFDRPHQKIFGVVQDITARKRIEIERETLIVELQHAIDHIRTLKGILPICASCKKVRDDEGYWQQVESYLAEHTDVQFSHGICPDCIRKHYPSMA